MKTIQEYFEECHIEESPIIRLPSVSLLIKENKIIGETGSDVKGNKYYWIGNVFWQDQTRFDGSKMQEYLRMQCLKAFW